MSIKKEELSFFEKKDLIRARMRQYYLDNRDKLIRYQAERYEREKAEILKSRLNITNETETKF